MCECCCVEEDEEGVAESVGGKLSVLVATLVGDVIDCVISFVTSTPSITLDLKYIHRNISVLNSEVFSYKILMDLGQLHISVLIT